MFEGKRFVVALVLSGLWTFQPPGLAAQGNETPGKSATEHSTAKKSPKIKKDEDDIREAVFRYQFQQYDAKGSRNFTVYLSVGDPQGPSDDFMKRFRKEMPFVKKSAEAVISPTEGVKNGIILIAEEVNWTHPDRAVVSGGYYIASLGAESNLYTVQRKNGKWAVTDVRLEWIS